jgi:hypothetical protein
MVALIVWPDKSSGADDNHDDHDADDDGDDADDDDDDDTFVLFSG